MIIGKADPFLPWIDNAASAYFQRITAEAKTYDRPVGVGHTLMNFPSGASTVQQRIREIVAASAGAVGAGVAALTVHDAAGRTVATLVRDDRTGGRHEAFWAGRDETGRPVPAGVYFLRLRAPDFAETRKIVRIR